MTLTRREALLAGAAVAATAPTLAHTAVKQNGFLWGVATEAHQIEGNNVNSDYWVMEHVSGTYFKEKSGDACDSWNRWREDLALVKAAGLNSHRFSVEWARIEPEAGEFSQATLDYYYRLRVACLEAGIEPVVTLHHFTSPRWPRRSWRRGRWPSARRGCWPCLALADRRAPKPKPFARASRSNWFGYGRGAPTVPIW